LANTLLPFVGLGGERNWNGVVSENLSAKDVALFSLEWLRVEVSDHLVGRAVVDFKVSFFNLIC